MIPEYTKILEPMAPRETKVTPPTPACQETAEDRSFLGRMRARLDCYRRDIDAVLAHDPAARSRAEVVLTYPGLHALWMHRAAHRLWGRDRKLAARVVSHLNRFVTGIEVHPGAKIGQGVFIDHGMGVVIGETATVGDGCILFKGVVLGGTQMQRTQRHPQLGKHVVVGSNACVLGNITIGDGARIGSGSVVVRPVPEGATVVGVPGRIVPPAGDRRARFDATLDHASLPDPVNEMFRSLATENQRLRARLERLEQKLDIAHEDEDDDHLIDGALSTNDLPPTHGG
jgi:serine O-acetyltransferase